MTRSGAALRVSVIITNWNYANYLRAAIDSVLAQTRAAHEIIVVDDGSTDGSRALIAAYGDRITPLLTPNGGQAAAFNAGFAASSGELILFLDADDCLKPEAIETICAAWHESYAGLSYALEVIDREGFSRGLYPEFPPDFDRRTQFVEAGTFSFLPTSGNVFARRVIEAASPLPAVRWRISADAYLVRVAALTGRIVPLRQVLGLYRIHEANNYLRLGAARLWIDRRALVDSGDLADYFASSPLITGDRNQTAAERVRLALAAARAKLALSEKGERRAQGGAALRRLAGRLATTAGAPLLPRIAVAAVAFAASLGFWRGPAIRNWLRFPHSRPTWLRGLIGLTGIERLRQWLLVTRIPRWPNPLPLDTAIRPETDATAQQYLAHGWSNPKLAGGPHTIARRAGLRLPIAPSPGALVLELSLTPLRPTGSEIVLVTVSLAGEVMVRVPLEEPGVVSVPLSARVVAAGATVDVDLLFEDAQTRDRWERVKRLAALPPMVILSAMDLRLAPDYRDPPALLDGRETAAADLVRHNAGEWAISGGDAVLTGALGAIAITTPPGGSAARLMLRVPEHQPPGWMRIAIDGLEVYSGTWGQGDRVWSRLPAPEIDATATRTLSFAFAPSDPLDRERPSLGAIAFRLETDNEGPPLVNPGQQLTFGPADLGRLALGEDWLLEGRNAVVAGGAGKLTLTLPAGLAALDAVFTVAPVFPTPDGQVHLIALASGDTLLTRLILQGEGEIAVPLDPVLAEGTGTARLTIQSFYVAIEEGELAVDAAPRPAPLKLNSVAFAGAWSPLPPLVPRKRFGGSIEELLTQAGETFEASADEAATSPLAQARSVVIAAVAAADDRAMQSLLAAADTIGRLTTLGARWLPGADAVPPRTSAGRLADIAVAMLTGPAAAMPALADLAKLPEPLLWYPRPLAAWLAGDAGLVDGEAYAEALFESATQLTATEQPGSPRRALAAAVVEAADLRHLYSAAGSGLGAMRAFSHALERHLTFGGHQLAWSFAPRERETLRVGILARDADAAVAVAVHASLAGGRCEPVVIAPGGDVSPGGLAPAAAVDVIRGLDLDAVVLADAIAGYDAFAVVAAHRLAPVQVTLAVAAPIACGLSSIDATLGADGDDALLPIGTTALASDEPEPPSLARRRLGLPVDAVLFATTAGHGTPGASLVGAWAAILAKAPAAQLLVLATASADLGKARAVLTEAGVGDRLIVRRDLDAAQTARAIGAAEAVLDTFPASSPAAVETALAAALPVVTLRGEHRRGRYGATRLSALGRAGDVADTRESFVERAVALAMDASLRTRASPPESPTVIGTSLAGALVALAAARGITLAEPAAPLAVPAVHAGPYRYLFHHMPKTGGTSSIVVLREWFKIYRDYREGWSTTGLPEPANLDELTPHDLICGHFELPELRLTRRYPAIIGNPEWRLFSIVRDPLELSLSGHFFENSERAKEPGFTPKTLSQRLREDPSDYIRHFDFTAGNWREVIDRYWFIGTAERLNESLQYIADALGEAMPEVPSLNATPRPGRPDPADVDAFARRHALDYTVYNEISERLDRRLRG